VTFLFSRSRVKLDRLGRPIREIREILKSVESWNAWNPFPRGWVPRPPIVPRRRSLGIRNGIGFFPPDFSAICEKSGGTVAAASRIGMDGIRGLVFGGKQHRTDVLALQAQLLRRPARRGTGRR